MTTPGQFQATINTNDSGFKTEVSFVVENTSYVDGATVPQIYLGFPEAAAEPGKRLVAFDRVALAAGEKQMVSLSFAKDAGARPYQILDEKTGAWSVVNGDYTIALGQSAQDVVLEYQQMIGR